MWGPNEGGKEEVTDDLVGYEEPIFHRQTKIRWEGGEDGDEQDTLSSVETAKDQDEHG